MQTGKKGAVFNHSIICVYVHMLREKTYLEKSRSWYSLLSMPTKKQWINYWWHEC